MDTSTAVLCFRSGNVATTFALQRQKEISRHTELTDRNTKRLAEYQLKRAAMLYAQAHQCTDANAIVIRGGVIYACA